MGLAAKRWWWIGGSAVCLSALVFAARSRELAAEQPSSAPPVQAIGPERVCQLPWGPGPAMAGRKDVDQGASEGPMSFAIDETGQTWLLDQVNGRVLRIDASGAVAGEIALMADTFQDLEVVGQYSMVLLDRLSRRSLVVMTATGTLVSETLIEGQGIAEGGGVTAMFAEPSGIWLEYAHTDRVRVLDADLRPCEREIERGRPYLPGERLMAAMHEQGRARLWVEDAMTGNTLRSIVAAPDHAIARIAWLQGDLEGNVHAVFHLLEFEPEDPTKVAYEGMLGVRYDQSLREAATWRSSWVIRRWEQFREFRVTQDGTVYQMGFDDQAVTVLRWRWQS